MAFSGLFMLSYLVTLPVLVAQWVGIMGLRHAGKSGAWWSMAAGVALGTLGTVLWVGAMIGFSTGGFRGTGSFMMISASALPALGSLLFGIGFAIHGLRASRSAQRVQELEQLAAAMSEEINQLRQGRNPV